MIPALDQYEGEGSLYERKTVTVNRDARGIEGVMEALVYVYLPETGAGTVLERWELTQK